MSKATPKSETTSKVKVTLVRSLYGQIKSHQETIRGLGLRRMNESAVVTTTPQILGMLRSAQHMLKVEKV
jgi:large subunit ribosomal protein L30